ncbi:MAG TPA: protein kinase, partial [Gemmatimonadaceae bacterium]|nr:protein kinase [Gemmatimonadaceae bacterium]
SDPMVDHRSDLYSLGVVGYEMLGGQPPFRGTSYQQVLVKHVTEDPVPIAQVRANLPATLAQVVMRCLEKQPGDRFQRAEEVREALESVGPTSGSMTVLAPRPAAPSRKILVFGGVAAVLLLASLLASRYLNANRPEFEVGATTQVTNDPGVEITPALSSDGKLLAYAGGPPTNTSIFVRQVSGGEAIRLASGRAPQWSADGTRLVYVDSAGISSVPALGGQPQRLVLRRGTSGRTIGVENIATSPAWSHDGMSLVYAALDTIWIAKADGSEPHMLTAAREPHSISWSPDDRRLAYVVGNAAFVYSAGQFGNIAPSSIWIVNRDGTGVTAITDSIHHGVSPVWTSDGDGLLYVSNIGGGRDLYYQRIRGNRPEGMPQRLTTGLKIHGIAVGADRVAYSLWNTSVGMWAVAMPTSGATSTGAARQITSASERIEAMNPSHDGQWLAFDSDRSGNSDIYKVRIDGTGLQQLTRNTADDFRPQWSPDGKWIGYHSWRTGNRDAYVVSSDGSNERLIAGGPGHQFGGGFSPDGKQIVLWTDHTGRFEIYTVPFEGGSLRQVTHNGGWMPSWSKDGKWIAYLGIDRTLRMVPAAGGPEKILVSPDVFGTIVAVGGWSADSRKIYFRVQRPDGSLDIAQVTPDGSNPSIVVHFDDRDRPAYRPDFSNDGKNFYFSVGHHEADIWVMDLRKK